MRKKILNIKPDSYTKHLIHGENRDWIETNCYVDVWIELLHAMGFEPIAALPYTLGIDFEGDQWTFFKYPLADLDRLYGLDVQELNIWRPLPECIAEQIDRGRHVLVELDSFFLPDTLGTAYKIEHVKTTVAINAFDFEKQRMEYFHNQAYHLVEGEDFKQLFLPAEQLNDRVLPPYVEYVKTRNRPKLSQAALVNESINCLKHQLLNIPQSNPFSLFKERFNNDFSDLNKVDIEYFHKYSFATLRQYGACFELCKTYLLWLQQQDKINNNLDLAIECFGKISTSSKLLQFQLARAVARKKTLDLSPLDDVILNWQKAMDILRESYI